MGPLVTAGHHRLAAAVGHLAALGLLGQNVGAVLPVGRAVASTALELQGEAEPGGEEPIRGSSRPWLQGAGHIIQIVTQPILFS